MAESHNGESNYRLLFESNPHPMWVYDAESLQFLTINEAAVARYGYSREEFLGMRITDIRPAEDVPSLLDDVAAPRDGLRDAGTWRHVRKDGTLILVEISTHEIAFEGRPARLVLAMDVTEREQAIDALRRSSEEYERQYAALAALTRRGILQATDTDAALREITQHTARTLGVERVSVWQLTPERDAIVAQDLFERSAGRHSAGVVLGAGSYPSYFRALAGSEVLVADDAETDPRTSEFTEGYLRPNGITSMLDAPVLVDGDLAGVLCLEHVGPPRKWTAGERSFAVSVANLIALIRAQASLSRSRTRLQTILDSEPECVALVSPDARLLEMNPAGLRMIEAADISSVLGREVVQLIHPSDRAAYLDLHRSVHDGNTGMLQFRIIGLGGTHRWLETHAAPLRSNGDQVVAMLSVTRDISDRIRTEEELHESRRRLTTLMDHLPGMAYRCSPDRDRIMEFVSNGARELTGYQPEDLSASGVRAYGGLVHPDDAQQAWDIVRHGIDSGEPFELEYRILAADGEEKWVWERGHAVYDADSNAIALEGFITDTTQRRQDADALRTSEERFRLLARATSDVIWDLDIERGQVWWGEGADSLFGTSRDQLGTVLGDWTDRVHPEDRERATESLNQAIESNMETWSCEYRFERGDGTYADVLDRGYVIRDDAGRAVRMVGGISDLSERKRLETQLLHSQKMESVGRLAAGVAHDFNNLLTVILGTVDLALASDVDEPLARDLLEIRGAAERATGLTQQLLAFSRRQVLQPRVLDINATISGTFALLRRLIGEDIHIRFSPGDDVWNVRADPGQLEQVLLNLAINARDAMPGGGNLTITTSNRAIDDAYLATHAEAVPGPHVMITVADTGVGMDTETRERAFEPFFTTKPVGKGTGLGLATVYGIVQQSGGFVNLYSEPGRGTTFRILLPRAEGTSVMEARSAPTTTQRGTGTVLLVEDEDAVRRLTQRVLSDAGYTVIAVHGPEEALAAADGGPAIDLLLTDVVMPGMNGPELARLVLERSPATHVLFMSGYTDDAIAQHGVQPAQTALLEKPFTIPELTHAVRAALG